MTRSIPQKSTFKTSNEQQGPVEYFLPFTEQKLSNKESANILQYINISKVGDFPGGSCLRFPRTNTRCLAQ